MDKFKEFADAVNRLRKSCERVRETLMDMDDSVPKVWLTINEAYLAQIVLWQIGNRATTEHCKNCLALADTIVERIEQAKKPDANH